MPDRDSLQFAILGPLEVTAAGTPLTLGGTQRKVLMTVLLLEVGQVVPIHRLLETIWGEDPPDRAMATLRTHVSELRRKLEAGPTPQVLVRKGTGYLLAVRPEQIDAWQARRLLEQGRRAVDDGDPVSAIAPLQEAQSLWRGPPLADVTDHPFARSYIEALEEVQLDVVKTRIAADLSLGRHREVLGDLRMLVARHPHDDGLCRELVLALYRDGRVEDAARACRDGLAARHDLGLDSPRLRRLQEDVLRGASGLAWAPPRSLGRPSPAAPVTGGGQPLPPDVAEYTGRDTIQSRACALLTDRAALGAGCVTVAFAGKAGAGKTALAVHIAHRVRAGFTDALYVDLRGTSEPLDPTRVLARFVQALGVSRAAVPADPDDLAEMYQELLATRRVLIILDNAAGEAQIRPLMPAGRGCAVLITSRSRLPGLTVPYWTVDVLIPSDAVELLTKVVGAARVEAEPEAARDIVGLCGYLPLAIQIAGRKLAAHPHWRLTRLAHRLANERDRLSWLEVGDLEIRASFQLSYAGRPPDEQRAFRLLSLPAVNDITPWAAAAVLDLDLDEAEDVVDRLADAQLLERRGTDPTGAERYRFHDLLRVFAREQETGVGTGVGAGTVTVWPEGDVAPDRTDGADRPDAAVPHDPPALSGEHRAALGRLLYAYLVMLRAAVDVFSPGRVRVLDPGRGWTGPGGDEEARLATWAVVDADDADLAQFVRRPLVWFATERSNLLALVGQAHAAGLDQPTWLLAAEAADFYAFGAHWGDWATTHELGLAAARRGGHRLAEAELLTNLGERELTLAFEEACWRLDAPGSDPDGKPAAAVSPDAADRLAAAVERFARARELLAGSEEELSDARAARGLAGTHRGRGELAEALAAFEACLAALRRGGARRGEAETLVSIAMAHGDRGELADGITCLTLSLSIARELGNQPLEAHAQRRLGDLYRHQHRPERALAAYNASLPLLADPPDPLWEPRVLVRRGDILAELDDHPAARRSWQRAATLLRQRRSPELAAVERRLSAPVTAGATQFTGGRLLGAFDPAYFITRVAASRRSVRLLNTWTDLVAAEHRDAFADAVLTAIDAGAIVQILLLDPDSAAAAARSADLAHRVDVAARIRANLLVLGGLRERLEPVLRPRLAVRLYGEQPLTTYHRWDSGALVSSFPVGFSSAATTQHEATVSSTLVQFVEQHFERLWSPQGSIALDDYLRVELRISPADAGGLVLGCEYVRRDGVVYVACPPLTELLARGGPDGLVATVADPGRHPLGDLGRRRVVPLRAGPDDASDGGGAGPGGDRGDGGAAVAATFTEKYGAPRQGLLRLASARRWG
ncbi:DNA-binding transcriptional activator of the SARP family [Frankia canadensis]|uniref:DNA-binding transcriptional activator of the SARP family n=1 Tax=Frankia canadensis TaxID=1836972 RepID=A0A2I2KMR9_9ACTN|nr:AfsR/SARP family transcriptional regulator [Frankia canadensis]SNQ46967.1 DNA-binding transcriptional activator of the SARP family [Frankia canadensis]SOU54257.1 DNA-binding transcriptional activator of the SARP family [Frankia canadensis]